MPSPLDVPPLPIDRSTAVVGTTSTLRQPTAGRFVLDPVDTTPIAPTEIGAAPLPVWREKRRVAGDVAITATEMSPAVADGTLDIELPAAVGDLITVGMNCQYDGNTTLVIEHNLRFLDAAAGTVRDLFPSGNIGAWTVRPIAFFGASRSLRLLVQTGDVPDGKLRIRLLAKIGASGSRSIFANGGTPLVFDAINHGKAAT